MFYGEAVMIGMMKCFPIMEEVWFDTSGNKKDLGYQLDGFTIGVLEIPAPLLETARAVSLKIPALFIRIDLQQTDEDPAFGGSRRDRSTSVGRLTEDSHFLSSVPLSGDETR